MKLFLKVDDDAPGAFRKYFVGLNHQYYNADLPQDMAECDMDEARQQFCDWLLENGARWPKIDWPSTKTVSGIRGGVAKEAIATDEHMIEIPIKLMMSPPAIFADPEVGVLLKSVEDSLYGDLLLTMFIMHELRKGSASFYSPFLKILPEPGNISEWSEEQLTLLQDHALLLRARNRRSSMKGMFTKTIPMLNRLSPEKFPLEEFTYERFKFAWNSVQARAFGKRLPWTAMVPFADCLNHSNVQTKYDYDVDGNGMFRLFPTGDNHYPQGAEVFNSYGRRPNENLLMDYGFTMLDNEWDDIELCMTIPREDPHFDLRYNALFLIGFNPNRKFVVTDTEVPFKALMFLRIALMDSKQLAVLVDRIQSQPVDPTDGEDTPPSVAKTVRIAQASPRTEALAWFGRVISAELEIKALSTLRDLLLAMLGEHSTSAAQDMSILDWLNARRIVSSPAASQVNATAVASDLSDSLDALTMGATAEKKLSSAAERLQKSVPELYEGLAALSVDSEAYWRTLSAVQYRLTRKRIIIGSVRTLDDLVSYFERAQRTLGEDKSSEEGGGESCTAMWDRAVTDDHTFSSVTGSSQSGVTARRTPTWDYLKRYRTYKHDAINPLHWPEL